jgi:hypothetical protein
MVSACLYRLLTRIGVFKTKDDQTCEEQGAPCEGWVRDGMGVRQLAPPRDADLALLVGVLDDWEERSAAESLLWISWGKDQCSECSEPEEEVAECSGGSDDERVAPSAAPTGPAADLWLWRQGG